MLDDNTTSDTTPNDTGPNGDGDSPPVKAVRRRRATKATSAPLAEGAVADAPGAGDPAPAGEDAAATPVKRTRKAPAKRAAKVVAPAADGDVSGETPAGVPPEHTPAEGGSAEADAPVKRAPRKRATKAAAPPITAAADASTDQAPVDQDAKPVTEADGSSTEDQADTAPRTRSRRRAPAAVAFQAPDAGQQTPAHVSSAADGETAEDEPTDAAEQPAAPRRRRRAGTSGVVSPGALAPVLLEPSAAPAADAEPDEDDESPEAEDQDDDRPKRRRRGRRGRGGASRQEGSDNGDDGDDAEGGAPEQASPGEADASEEDEGSTRRRRRRRRGGGGGGAEDDGDDGVPTVTHVREPRERQQRVRGASAADEDGVRGISGSTRMAAKRARRQEGRDSGRKRPPVLSEAEFLARREAVERTMVVRQQGDRTQIAVLEDGVLVEHYVTRASAQAFAGNVYLGRVQNVLPSMEAAFLDIGKGKNGVLYAGEVNYELAGSGPRKIESALKSGQEVLVQVSKEPIGHKGARLTSAVSLPGRYLVYVPTGSMTGISRKLPEQERARLKAILKKVVPDDAGVIIRTAAEGASEAEISADVERLQGQWEQILEKAKKGGAPKQLHAEPDLVVRVVRDVFNEDFASLVVQGDSEWDTIREYVEGVAPDLAPRLSRHTAEKDVFAEHRVDEQLAKALDRKVWLPSGGSLVIDRTEAMVVVDVNTGKFVGKGGNLEETVTRNNLEAAEEIARQLRLRDLGGIIVVDFIDMVLESNRDLVVRRLVECMGRDRTKHQVAEVTSLGLVQMTRKRVGQGLLESFSHTCERCEGRGVVVSTTPVDALDAPATDDAPSRSRRGRGSRAETPTPPPAPAVDEEAARRAVAAVAAIARASAKSGDAPVEIDDLDVGAVAIALQDGSEELGATPSPAEEAPSRRARGGRRRSGRTAGAAPGSDPGDTADAGDELRGNEVAAGPDVAAEVTTPASDAPVHDAPDDVPVASPETVQPGSAVEEPSRPTRGGGRRRAGRGAGAAPDVAPLPVADPVSPPPTEAGPPDDVAPVDEPALVPEAEPAPVEDTDSPAPSAPRRRRRATS